MARKANKVNKVKKVKKVPKAKHPRKRRTVTAGEEARHRLAANLRRLREERGVTQEELARRVGIASRTRLSDIERGVYAVSIDGLERLSVALRVDMVELLRPIE